MRTAPAPVRPEPMGEVLETTSRPVTTATPASKSPRPVGAAEPPPPDRGTRPATPSSKPRQVTVKANDSLWAIAAAHYGEGRALAMSKEIRKLNKLSSDRLSPGQVLKLPEVPMKVAAASTKPGERVISGAPDKGERPAAAVRKSGAASLPWEPGPVNYGTSSGRSAARGSGECEQTLDS